jgi:hypothetical protein
MIFVCLIMLFLVPSVAQADLPGYPKGQRTAEKKAAKYADTKYDMIGTGAVCQRSKENWKCVWTGMVRVDGEYEPVYGRVLLSKSSTKMLNGMHWGYPSSV